MWWVCLFMYSVNTFVNTFIGKAWFLVDVYQWHVKEPKFIQFSEAKWNWPKIYYIHSYLSWWDVKERTHKKQTVATFSCTCERFSLYRNMKLPCFGKMVRRRLSVSMHVFYRFIFAFSTLLITDSGFGVVDLILAYLLAVARKKCSKEAKFAWKIGFSHFPRHSLNDVFHGECRALCRRYCDVPSLLSISQKCKK